MAPTPRSDLYLGATVTAADTLVRWRGYLPGLGGVVKRWVRYGERTAQHGWSVNKPGTRPVTGIVVGIRQLDEEGRTYWGDSETPTVWQRTSARRTAVQIAFDLHQNPALAWLEDVTIGGAL